ncbi:uncharacterized protein DUF3822 [Maribacter vaceletii]|uniref:Uncharacterized protein DUF3822 n=1 Tax=Maribacter vaceletii TaxID=1206816 RepID=A0A495DTW4_9FLAO|nr:DUF3822 family protein [Maribacter vaceletii]RKR08084.1 uncharacterized protein DUF3822 [Maribacter vaceletii]
MTKRTNNITNIGDNDYKKLSIQISLNGLSFCIADTISNKIIASKSLLFKEEVNPNALVKELKPVLEENNITAQKFSEVIVIHKNLLYSLVPKALFNPNELESYLNFNSKILATDLLAYDEIENHDIIPVYVPFVNINNYIYDLFGEFTYKHNSSVMIQTLLGLSNTSKEAICYIHVSEKYMDITILKNKKIILHNSFNFNSKEDFIYYILFTLEQLNLDPETVVLKLFGAIEEGDNLYDISYKYIKNITIFIPKNTYHPIDESNSEAIDFTVLNAL